MQEEITEDPIMKDQPISINVLKVEIIQAKRLVKQLTIKDRALLEDCAPLRK
jgi:hypothetical protein